MPVQRFSAGIRTFTEAVRAAGAWAVDASWPHISALVRSKSADKQLLLVAIEAAAWIRPQEAAELLADLTDSADEDIAEAAYEALAMAGGSFDDNDDELRSGTSAHA